MRLYLEIRELVETSGSAREFKQEIESEDAAQPLLAALKPQWKGRRCIAFIHYCRHDEGRPCEVKVLEL